MNRLGDFSQWKESSEEDTKWHGWIFDLAHDAWVRVGRTPRSRHTMAIYWSILVTLEVKLALLLVHHTFTAGHFPRNAVHRRIFRHRITIRCKFISDFSNPLIISPKTLVLIKLNDLHLSENVMNSYWFSVALRRRKIELHSHHRNGPNWDGILRKNQLSWPWNTWLLLNMYERWKVVLRFCSLLTGQFKRRYLPRLPLFPFHPRQSGVSTLLKIHEIFNVPSACGLTSDLVRSNVKPRHKAARSPEGTSLFPQKLRHTRRSKLPSPLRKLLATLVHPRGTGLTSIASMRVCTLPTVPLLLGSLAISLQINRLKNFYVYPDWRAHNSTRIFLFQLTRTRSLLTQVFSHQQSLFISETITRFRNGKQKSCRFW